MKTPTPADTILRGTGLYGDGECGEETFTCSPAEFARDNGYEPDDPDLLSVLALQPGEETTLDCGAGGAWRIRCLTMDQAAAELDREVAS
jgi:hypothetical protein